ncbi:MAG: hypothetical protein UT84_C0022G0006 [Candidatus Curtissbacteria bacterium GW2011_GWA1_40_16]|uniref:Uncharacterized protein n=1 Tax=Candidatus Curtissbacteria bacterium GW2011_GWA1_40_16 TaxID=1618405 RepID=A0A0G0RBA0_9BACT|nr:MAG: hypothetical protein UT84_C0022G0006 [Candidatus Curtissbacteria bacterium GW2011_GWA1_40_16]
MSLKDWLARQVEEVNRRKELKQKELKNKPFGGLFSLLVFSKKCPRCDSTNLNKVKPSLMKQALPGSAFLLFGPLGLLAKQPKTLNVCRNCGFSWEDR